MAFRPRPYRSYAKVHEPQSPFPPSIFALPHLVLKINMTQKTRKEMEVC